MRLLEKLFSYAAALKRFYFVIRTETRLKVKETWKTQTEKERKVHCSYLYIALDSAQHETWTWSQLPENRKNIKFESERVRQKLLSLYVEIVFQMTRNRVTAVLHFVTSLGLPAGGDWRDWKWKISLKCDREPHDSRENVQLHSFSS